ncbi:MAG: hypothetical protein LBN35_00265, partial [Clostridiales Family XIII bacterium]|nr:hypothetical protein [Clostridiales Family XIII bacterium]
MASGGDSGTADKTGTLDEPGTADEAATQPEGLTTGEAIEQPGEEAAAGVPADDPEKNIPEVSDDVLPVIEEDSATGDTPPEEPVKKTPKKGSIETLDDATVSNIAITYTTNNDIEFADGGVAADYIWDYVGDYSYQTTVQIGISAPGTNRKVTLTAPQGMSFADPTGVPSGLSVTRQSGNSVAVISIDDELGIGGV